MTMSSAEHWQAWLERWGDAYDTDDERRAAYRDHQDELARMAAVVDGLRGEQGQ